MAHNDRRTRELSHPLCPFLRTAYEEHRGDINRRVRIGQQVVHSIHYGIQLLQHSGKNAAALICADGPTKVCVAVPGLLGWVVFEAPDRRPTTHTQTHPTMAKKQCALLL